MTTGARLVGIPSASAGPANAATSAKAPVVSPARCFIDLFPLKWNLQAEVPPDAFHWVGLPNAANWADQCSLLKSAIRVQSLCILAHKLQSVARMHQRPAFVPVIRTAARQLVQEVKGRAAAVWPFRTAVSHLAETVRDDLAHEARQRLPIQLATRHPAASAGIRPEGQCAVAGRHRTVDE